METLFSCYPFIIVNIGAKASILLSISWPKRVVTNIVVCCGEKPATSPNFVRRVTLEEKTMKTVHPRNVVHIFVLTSLLLTLLGSAAFPITNVHAAGIWYVATTGDDANSCSDIAAPCLTINAALGKAASGDTVEVAAGTYMGSGTEVVLIDRDITLSGGWDASFTIQDGEAVIDGQQKRRGITVYNFLTKVIAVIDHFRIQNGYGPNYGMAGGIVNSGILTVNNSFISNNVSQSDAGGIYNNGTLTIYNSTISGNGGGLFTAINGTAFINNSTINNNVVYEIHDKSYGGQGIWADGKVLLNNSTVSGNSGVGVLVGFQSGVSAATINNSTVSNNGVGLRAGFGTISLQNTIVAGNRNGDCLDDKERVKSNGYNLIGIVNYCDFVPTTGDLIGTIKHPVDPRLSPLQNSGGATFTHALQPGSPAIDAGNPATPGSGGNACLATDQRGLARPDGGACDIGAFEVGLPTVLAVKRVDPNPTRESTVNFTVTFSEVVTGVDISAPFSDFALATTGITDASITAVAGSGDTYQVAVNTGLGNGSIRLLVLDDDSIQNATGKPLGGPGPGNGVFTTGEIYGVRKTPLPIAPVGNMNNPTPTYKWARFAGATKYQYEVMKGATLVYTQTVASKACKGSTCTDTPATTLKAGVYQWRVRALVGGVWGNYSSYQKFSLYILRAGYWSGARIEFYITKLGKIEKFTIIFPTTKCPNHKITYDRRLSVTNKSFSFNAGTYYVNGTFSSATQASGWFGFGGYVDDCATLNSGPYYWKASWRNSSLPALTNSTGLESVVFEPDPEAASGNATVERVSP
jgi:hypothetical protein